MLREVKELVQNHPAHQQQKLDSDKALILPTAIACLGGVKGVPVGDTNLPHSLCAFEQVTQPSQASIF